MSDELNARALRLLATREHSRAELRNKLGGNVPVDEMEAMLDRLVELGFQSDARFAEMYVRAKGERLGASRLKHELSQRGIARDLVEAALEHLVSDEGAGDELVRAREVWNRKFGELPQNAKEWAKQARFLQSRGFSTGIIRQVLKEVTDESAAG